MFKGISALVLTAFVSTMAHAQLLPLTVPDNAVVKSSVKISTGGKASVGGKDYDLITAASGIRQKAPFFVPVDIYVLQILVTDKDRFVKTDSGALASLDNEKAVALVFSPVSSLLSLARLISSFEEALHNNKIALSDPEIAAFIKTAGQIGEPKSGSNVTIVIAKNDDATESLVIENSAVIDPATKKALVTKPIVGPKGFTAKILSIWLGDVSKDEYLVNLKAELLK